MLTSQIGEEEEQEEEEEAQGESMQSGERVLSRAEIAFNEHWIVIGSGVYDISGYLKRHPGGSKVLERYFHGGNATKAFDSTGHSDGAHKFLETLRVGRLVSDAEESDEAHQRGRGGTPVLGKFFTREDRFQIHKALGLYVLLHYVYRHVRLFLGHPSAGFDASLGSLLSLAPHALLSGSSFIFHVPRERVAGRPMIWQEFRAHNVTFALRSCLCFLFLWVAERARLAAAGPEARLRWRGFAVCGGAVAVFVAMRVADEATRLLRVDARESTTSTMPYWDGCPQQTQARFKAFYTLAQILATLGCLAMFDLMWPFAIMLPIQLASLLMTCVRKGVLSTRGYHFIYTGSLVVPFLVGLRSGPALFPPLVVVGALLFVLRLRLPRGAVGAKYALWAPIGAARVGTFFLSGM